MALIQTRPNELELYTQLSSGEEGYIDPSTLMFMIDNSSWTKAKRFPYTSMSGISSHEEGGTLSGLVAHTVNITFGSSFTIKPMTLLFHVYRMEAVSNGVWRMKDIPYGSTSKNWLTTSGFNIEIDAKITDLTGVIIEYLFR